MLMNAKGEGLNIVSAFKNADHPASGAFRCLKLEPFGEFCRSERIIPVGIESGRDENEIRGIFDQQRQQLVFNLVKVCSIFRPGRKRQIPGKPASGPPAGFIYFG